MPTSALRESANAIRERVGPRARYSRFIPPDVSEAAPSADRRLGRVLWAASLVLASVVVVLALIVALGL